MKLAASRWLIAVAAAFPLLCAYTCAVPLGPGYHIEKESVELSFISQPEPRLHLQGHYRLENAGNSPLASLDMTVPNKDSLARQNLHVTVDGKDAQITERLADIGTMSIAQISFEPAWQPHQKKDIEIACDLAAGHNDRTMMAADAFAFDGAEWLPVFHAPKGLFAKGEQRADLTYLSIVTPKDFLAVASGLQIGRKARGETIEYRYRLLEKDGSPFVVAGRYKQQSAKIKKDSVYLWTFQGLPEDEVKSAGEQLAAAAQFFDSNFVARPRGGAQVWVVEIPKNQIFNLQNAVAATTASFPNMILLDNDVLSQNIGRGQVSPDEIGLLSDTWLQWMASAKENQPTLEDSLRSYMVDAFYESREGAYRQKKIAESLGRYDMLSSRSPEKPIVQVSLTPSDSVDQINMALAKASLFPYALGDACGQAPFRQGIGVMISDLRGGKYSYDDLRAALGTECGPNVNVDALFRSWLLGKGIPSEFRGRYRAAPAQQDEK